MRAVDVGKLHAYHPGASLECESVIFFIDESGHPHPNDPTSRPVLGAVGCAIADSRDLTRQLHRLRHDIFGEIGLELEKKWKAQQILNERTFRRERRKWEYADGLFDLACSFPVVSFFVVMERPPCAVRVSPEFLPPHIRFLLQRINAYMAERSPERKAIIVFDSQDARSDAHLSAAVTNYLFRTPTGQGWRHLLEAPLFVESSILPGIQIADYFVSCVRQFYQRVGPAGEPTTPYDRAITRLHRDVSRTILDLPREDGTRLFGEYRMPARMWERPESAEEIEGDVPSD